MFSDFINYDDDVGCVKVFCDFHKVPNTIDEFVPEIPLIQVRAWVRNVLAGVANEPIIDQMSEITRNVTQQRNNLRVRIAHVLRLMLNCGPQLAVAYEIELQKNIKDHNWVEVGTLYERYMSYWLQLRCLLLEFKSMLPGAVNYNYSTITLDQLLPDSIHVQCFQINKIKKSFNPKKFVFKSIRNAHDLIELVDQSKLDKTCSRSHKCQLFSQHLKEVADDPLLNPSEHIGTLMHANGWNAGCDSILFVETVNNELCVLMFEMKYSMSDQSVLKFSECVYKNDLCQLQIQNHPKHMSKWFVYCQPCSM